MEPRRQEPGSAVAPMWHGPSWVCLSPHLEAPQPPGQPCQCLAMVTAQNPNIFLPSFRWNFLCCFFIKLVPVASQAGGHGRAEPASLAPSPTRGSWAEPEPPVEAGAGVGGRSATLLQAQACSRPSPARRPLRSFQLKSPQPQDRPFFSLLSWLRCSHRDKSTASPARGMPGGREEPCRSNRPGLAEGSLHIYCALMRRHGLLPAFGPQGCFAGSQPAPRPWQGRAGLRESSGVSPPGTTVAAMSPSASSSPAGDVLCRGR